MTRTCITGTMSTFTSTTVILLRLGYTWQQTLYRYSTVFSPLDRPLKQLKIVGKTVELTVAKTVETHLWLAYTGQGAESAALYERVLDRIFSDLLAYFQPLETEENAEESAEESSTAAAQAVRTLHYFVYIAEHIYALQVLCTQSMYPSICKSYMYMWHVIIIALCIRHTATVVTAASYAINCYCHVVCI
jgi:hypothetical protein